MTPLLTVRAFIAKHQHLFYQQTWYDGERFMLATVPTREMEPPCSVIGAGQTPGRSHMLEGAPLASVAELVAQYVRNPKALVWQRYLWTSDVDRHGQRVFVGNNGYGLEVHRHLKITERWGAPVWR